MLTPEADEEQLIKEAILKCIDPEARLTGTAPKGPLARQVREALGDTHGGYQGGRR